MQLVPRCALDEIDKLLLHVRKGCLFNIPPTGGTSRNEGIHRVLNKSLKKSRIGIQFAIALLGAFFYIWNEEQLSGEQTRKKIRVEAGQFIRFDPNIVTFVKSTLTLLHSKFSSQRNSTSLDDILANYSMRRVLISPNGNCFFLAIAYDALGHVIPKRPDSEEILQHLDSLGLESCSSGEDVCAKLRKLMFDEWMTHPDLYQSCSK